MHVFYLYLYMHIGRPFVMHPYDEDILDASVDSSTSDQWDTAKHGQFIYLHYACSLSWHLKQAKLYSKLHMHVWLFL